MAVPTVTSVTPSSGGCAGGTTVLIVGTGFTGTTVVAFGGAASDFEVSSNTLLAATTPLYTAGAVTVVVTNATGPSTDVVQFTYSGGTLFTVAEARAFDKAQLANAALYSSLTITAAEADIRAEFAEILGFYPVPTVTTAEKYDGDGSITLLLKRPEVTALTAVVVTDTDHTADTWDAGELADVTTYPQGKLVCFGGGYFPRGRQNIAVTYTSGLSTLPGDLKRAALMVCVRRLIASDLPWESDTGSFDGGINWTATVDPSRSRWYGNDKVDGVLNRYRRVLPGIA